MKTMPDNCIDTIITDPPYGLKFMGQKWDYDVPSIEIWQGCLRVLKPGGTALIFAGPRTQHRMAVNIEDAGFILKDCIIWLFGSGFPKATDISQILDKDECRKQLEKKLGRKPTQGEFKKKWKKFRKVIGSRCMHYPDTENWSNKSNAYTDNSNATVKIAPGTYGENFSRPVTAPATPEATLWDGWKSHGLKPAYEPILVVMKPNEGSYANNALKWDVAGLNIDGGRIPYENKKDIYFGHHNKVYNPEWKKDSCFGANGVGNLYDENLKGRFPANVILDEEAGEMLDEQSGMLCSKWGKDTRKHINPFTPNPEEDKYENVNKESSFKGDKGGASRFFYCAKASKKERNKGCEKLEKKARGNINKMMGEAGNFKTGNGNIRTVKFKNHHPTVKPLALMKYLCMLTKTPTGGIVLDPFCGSGTTLMACKELKRDYIGIDNNPEYCEIARKRVNSIPESLF